MISCSEQRLPWHWFSVDSDDCPAPLPDWQVTGGDLARDSGLHSAVLTQLLTDKRSDGKHGWWGDQFMSFEIGSYLWRLDGKNIDDQALIDAERYARDALEPLIAQGLASDVDVEARKTNGRLEIEVSMFQGRETYNQTITRIS